MLTSMSSAKVSTANSTVDIFDMQLKAYATQIRYETLQDSYDLRIKQLEQENTRQFWLNIALGIALGYAAGNSK